MVVQFDSLKPAETPGEAEISEEVPEIGVEVQISKDIPVAPGRCLISERNDRVHAIELERFLRRSDMVRAAQPEELIPPEADYKEKTMVSRRERLSSQPEVPSAEVQLHDAVYIAAFQIPHPADEKVTFLLDENFPTPSQEAEFDRGAEVTVCDTKIVDQASCRVADVRTGGDVAPTDSKKCRQNNSEEQNESNSTTLLNSRRSSPGSSSRSSLSFLAKRHEKLALRCTYTKCLSLFNKLPEIRQLTYGTQLHTLALTETWLTGDISDSGLNVPGYSFYRADSARRRMGGSFLAEIFRDYYSEVHNVASPGWHPVQPLQNVKQPLVTAAFSVLDVEDLLLNVASHSAIGPDMIHPRILGEAASSLAEPLYKLFK
ncbi:uncharacterized protein DEA37_0010273 [Paragonimus westermani]|uniref:Uncharacterized protein n=1 Tax=Paragonimus westermani TaxID=34504 RepID=A0A5J4N8E3_9TREM|nr:uncharacterized protein DEA37_0010273 [Paragonimus westermani]